MKENKGTLLAFSLVTSLFFLWGFAHNLDPILIPHLKKSFTLTTTQATLVDSAVFAAYFVMAIPAGLLMKKAGYKAGIITGLICFAIGCFLFVPAANKQSYQFFLFALFIIACSLISMYIVGGAVLPRLFGYISDATGNVQLGYMVPFICFMVVALFAFKGHRQQA